MRQDTLPYDISIPEPCPADWHGMETVSSASRHCESCARQVHDLSRLSAREVRRLVERTDGHFCARVTHRADGSLLLRNDPPRSAVWPGAGFVLAAALAGAGVATSANAQAAPVQTLQAAPESAAAGQARAAEPQLSPNHAEEVPGANAPEVVLGGLIRPAKQLTTLDGRLLAPGGEAIRFGTILLTAPRGRQYRREAGANGEFHLLLPPGKYTVTASVEGREGGYWYGTETLVIREGAQTRDFRPSEPMRVTAGAPAVAPTVAPTVGKVKPKI